MDSIQEESKNTEDRHELQKAFDKLRHEINSIRDRMNSIGKEREDWLAKKREISGEIRAKISSFRENKSKRDTFTGKVKELKEKRDSSRKQLDEKISSAKKISEDTKAAASKGRLESPSRLKRMIESIETKMETEVMSFQKEKELAKKVREIKKSLQESAEAIKSSSDIKHLSQDITMQKKIVYALHNEVQKNASESQKMHQDMVKHSKEIDELKKKEKEALENFLKNKKEFSELNKALKEKFALIDEVKQKLDRIRGEDEEKRRSRQKEMMDTKQSEIEQKFKTGKKLTTEDFLAFQDAAKWKK